MAQPAYATIGYRFAAALRQRANDLTPATLANPATDDMILACFVNLFDSVQQLIDHNQVLCDRLTTLEAQIPVKPVVAPESPVSAVWATMRKADAIAAAIKTQYEGDPVAAAALLHPPEALPTPEDTFELQTQKCTAVHNGKVLPNGFVDLATDKPTPVEVRTYKIHNRTLKLLKPECLATLRMLDITHWSQVVDGWPVGSFARCGWPVEKALRDWEKERNQMRNRDLKESGHVTRLGSR